MTGLLSLLGLLLVGMGMDAFSNDNAVGSPDPNPGPGPGGGANSAESSGNILDDAAAQPDNPAANISDGESEEADMARPVMSGGVLSGVETAKASGAGNSDGDTANDGAPVVPGPDQAIVTAGAGQDAEEAVGDIPILGGNDDPLIGDRDNNERVEDADTGLFRTASSDPAASVATSADIPGNDNAPLSGEDGVPAANAVMEPEAGTLWAASTEVADLQEPVVIEQFDADEDVLAVFIGDNGIAAGEVTLTDADNGDVLVALDAQIVMRVVGGQGSVTADMVRQVEGAPPLLS